MKTYYLIQFLFQIGRTLPHSILVIFLIAKFNLANSDVLIFQLFWFFPIVLLEIPSGFISDRISRKITFFLSLVMIIFGYLLIGLSPVLIGAFAGQFLYGVSTALSSGTLEISIINAIKEKSSNKKLAEKRIDSFVASERIAMYSGMMIGGFSGSFIYAWISNYLYLVAVGVFTICAIVLVLFSKNIKEIQEKVLLKTFLKDLKTNNRTLLKNKQYIGAVIFVILTSVIFLSIFYNFWPVLFQDNGLDSKYFGIIYVFFQLCAIIAGFCFKKIKKKKNLIATLLYLTFAFSFVFSLVFFSGFPLIILLITSFVFFEFFQINNQSIIYKAISKKNASTQMSITSFLFNLFSLLTLVFSIVFLEFFNIKILLIVIVTLGFLMMVIFFLTNYLKKKNSKNSRKTSL